MISYFSLGCALLRSRLAISVEVFLWVLVPAGFLYKYVSTFGADCAVVVPHLLLVFSLWLAFFSFRMLNWRLGSWLGRGQRLLGVGLFVLPFLMLFAWYVLVLVGLASWGRVPTWPLLQVYLFQGFYLIGVLGVSTWALLLVLSGAIFLFGWGCRKILSLDSARLASAKLTLPGLIAISLLGVAGAGGHFALKALGLDDFHPQEPIGVSFFPNSAPKLQTHAVSVPPLVDAIEREAFNAYGPKKSFNPRNVVLIVGDALRADHMGMYGYSQPTTPLLEAAAVLHQTLMASNTRSICAESSCGLMAIASSRPLHLLPNKPLTLHEVLRRHGYKVHLILSGDHTNFYGLKEAYGEVDSYSDGTTQAARYINDDLLIMDRIDELPQYSGGAPVMFQFHFMSAHGLGLKQEQGGLFLPSVNYYRWSMGKNGRKSPSLEDIPKAVNYYDNGVLQFDLFVNRALERLEAKGYLDNAVVVIVADHGEMLGEKDFFGHQFRVHEPVLNIPFILQRRGYSGEEFGDWKFTSQIDVSPTILHELDIDPPSVWKGEALQLPARSRFLHFQQAPMVGLYSISTENSILKYWKDLEQGGEFVFDLSEDPSESSNIVDMVDLEVMQEWRREVMSSALFK
ncbi:sulfatase-like hydrolase/transferase [Ectopseudomonas guguanensis]|uniref:sulfatase-like hydrolase/transferase n=1 Tax=Ectopseudomonas guguanensis TaxID=1198456 RepID=UPI001428D7B6|nr:sulfatase-like hydrolase/transferase [Pseudomonas guguanensis]